MTHTKNEALKLALEDYLSREMPAGTVISNPKWWAGKIANAIKQALAQPAPVQEPCDMGAICVGCSPRNADGSCPLQPNLACNRYVKGFNDGMKEMDGMEPYTTPPAAQPAGETK